MPDAPAIAVREAGAADAGLLSLVASATFLDWFGDSIPGDDILAHCSTVLSPAAFAAALAKPSTRAWLAEIAGTGAPVGYALICDPELPIATAPGDLELKRIYLLSRRHGSGAARAMMDAAIAAARAAGAKRLLIGVYDQNWRAHAFYEKCGFTVVGERNFTVGSASYHDLIFARDL
jgi:ribosomal protein S18 acetylase RimI-like enzyme